VRPDRPSTAGRMGTARRQRGPVAIVASPGPCTGAVAPRREASGDGGWAPDRPRGARHEGGCARPADAAVGRAALAPEVPRHATGSAWEAAQRTAGRRPAVGALAAAGELDTPVSFPGPEPPRRHEADAQVLLRLCRCGSPCRRTSGGAGPHLGRPPHRGDAWRPSPGVTRASPRAADTWCDRTTRPGAPGPVLRNVGVSDQPRETPPESPR
jgi:hypothetical protein